MTAADIRSDIRTEMASSLLARNWWAVGLRAVAAIVFGLIALFMPGVTMLSLVLVFAAVMFVDGFANLISGIRSARQNERWGTLILHGVISLIAGVAALAFPGLTVIAFVYVMAVWAVVSGLLELVAAVRLRGDHGRWWMGFGGALSIVAGVVLAIAPLVGAVVLTWWLGAYAIVFGGTLLFLAYRLRTRLSEAAHGVTPHPA